MGYSLALGMLEVYGYLGNVEGLDAALKAASVKYVSIERIGAGLTTFFIEGEVSAVKASVDAAEAEAEKVCTVISKHVIPRPAPEVREMLNNRPIRVVKSAQKEELPEKTEAKKQQKAEVNLEKMTVNELRTLARNTEGVSMTRNEIKYAKKKDLIEAIRKEEAK